MHSSVNNHDTSTSILSIGEMIGIVVVFSFMLYLLFPKQDIEHIIETKGKNTNLSINYLESMLLYYPDNIKLEMILLQNYDYENKRKKAFELINKVLSQTKDKEILDKLYRTEYRLLKEEYFDTKDKKLLPQIKDKLYKYYKFVGEDRDYVYFFAEATQMNFKEFKYLSLKGLMKQKPELINYRLEKEAYFLASSLNYKDEAQRFLINLTKYPEIAQDLKDNALSILLDEKEYDKAITLATKLFQNAKDRDKKETYFNIALYATSLAHENDSNKTAINELIDTYKYSVILDTHNIYFILDNLLKVGDTKGASSFAQESFDIYADRFDENCTDLAIKAMTYNQDLEPALNLALFAEDKFKNSKWLDKAIELSIWQGKMKYAVELNIKGYREYKNKKYEKYLLEKTILDSGYKILGEIYRKKVESGDYSFIDKLAEYFDYTAKTSQGEEYFTKLLKKHKTKEILKQTISFSYKNNSYKKGLKLYYRYKSKYGIDKNLQKSSINKLIALKKFKKAYRLTKELETKEKYDKKLIELMKKLKIEDKFHIYKKLTSLAWIYKDYKYLYKLLWKLEAIGELKEDEYSKLITLDQELNRGKKLAYLYKKVWQKTHKTNYLMALLYEYMDKQDFKNFASTRDKIPPKDRKILEKDISYNILLANYYAQTKQIKKASKYFATALKLDPHSSTTHQSYIWFLLDNRFNKQLKKELRLLRKNPRLQKEVGFPSVVGALQFQKTDLALKWLTPLLKSNDNLEYQVVYADILQLQDREEGANKVRLKLFRKLNRMIKKSPKLLEDKAFARVYLRLVVMFTSPYERKNFYFKKFKHLFNQKDFMDMKIGWKSYIQSEAEVKYLASKYHMNLPWLRLYIAMSRGDNQAKQELLKNYKDILAFRDRVTATKDIGDRVGAYSLAFEGMEDNQRDVDLYKIYEGMVNSDYPKGEFKSRYKKLSKDITDIENQVSYRWRLYKGIDSTLSFHQYRYIQDNGKNFVDDRVALSINNSYKRVLWSIEIAKHFAQRDFISSILKLGYRNSEIELGVEAKYHTKTNQTKRLQIAGVKNSIKLNIKRKLSNRINILSSYKKSNYQQQSREDIGNSEEFKIGGDYLLRAGYPDIRFTSYLLYKSKNIKENISKKSIELGSQLSVGAIQNKKIHQDWRPFGVLGLSVNDRDEIGTNLSLGVSGTLKGGDVLNISIDYSKGMDMISYPYYGVSLDYRF